MSPSTTANKIGHLPCQNSAADGLPAAPVECFRPGDLVQVRSVDEIMATLDQNGMLEGLPFMPEMVACCGRQFRVAKRAHKTCERGLRRVREKNVVHLAGARCDGSAHGSCQAQCQFFWKEAWLKRVDRQGTEAPQAINPARGSFIEIKTISAASQDPVRYTCQATEILRFSDPLRLRNLVQFMDDLRSGNFGRRELRIAMLAIVNYVCWLMYRMAHRDSLRARRGTTYVTVGLKPGDIVRVRNRNEMFATVDDRRTTRGLGLSIDMFRYCGQEFRVASRVERLIDPKTGCMKELKNECLVLDGVSCGGAFMLCPRDVFHFWREDWLQLRLAADTSAISCGVLPCGRRCNGLEDAPKAEGHS